MATANERLFDLALRHQIDIRRFTVGEVRRILRLLEAIDAEVVKKLRRDLVGLADGTPMKFTANQEKRLQAIFADVALVREAAWKQVTGEATKSMEELALIEADVELKTIENASPVVLLLVGVEVSQLRAVAVSRPFHGRLLGEWFQSLEQADRQRLEQAIRLGLSLGESLDTIVRRVVGTRARGYKDGAMTMSRRNAEAVVRTAINHTSNAAREEVWSRNADILAGLRWSSTLDGRTSAVCRARDGHVTPVGEGPVPTGMPPLSPPGARPPAHVNCRSTMVPILRGEQIVAERATVRDTRTRKQMDKDFRAEAQAAAGDKWSDLTEADRRKLIDKRRVAWAKENVGQEPETTNYSGWLKKQPAAFQDEVLGKAKGALFRRGGLELDQYVDRQGNELTLVELRGRYPDAFDKAGV